ncbi:protein BCCIP homolog isoform X2 [Durio zibethinus]|uniref:Protein BCCIP homolog isoform X2 n=1 Tax=Durio zibethinus TaxID=66656 RepID=A0A6P5Y448_DURZI|nr:protein BCCIP homolog isoform X2 [Durio zibethinus]
MEEFPKRENPTGKVEAEILMLDFKTPSTSIKTRHSCRGSWRSSALSPQFLAFINGAASTKIQRRRNKLQSIFSLQNCSEKASFAHIYQRFNKMPRKPTRHRRLLPVQPLTFSPFARSVARVATAYLLNHHIRDATQQSAGVELNEKLKKVDRQSESSEDEAFDGVVQADFAFFDPKPDDFHGVKTLLQTYLDNKQWDLSGFIDLILGQTTVGTVVKLEGDEDNGVFSVITALNLGRYKDKDKIGNLRALLGDKSLNVGLLVSQRVVNLPPELLPHLYDALFDEVSWATEDEPTEELRNSFHFKFYILVSKIYEHKNANQKRSSSADKDEAIIYIKPEDEIFRKLSIWSFLFPLQIQQVTTHELKNYQLTGIVMAVKAENISSFRQQLRTLINES